MNLATMPLQIRLNNSSGQAFLNEGGIFLKHYFGTIFGEIQGLLVSPKKKNICTHALSPKRNETQETEKEERQTRKVKQRETRG